MILPEAGQTRPCFLMIQIPEFLERFSLSYEQNDETCMEYFLFSKDKLTEISRSLIFSHETFSKSLYVSKFYPEIYKEINCRFLSAACFYLIAHHAIQQFHLSDNCFVNLETEETVFDSFYSRLADFNFKIKCNRPANRLYLRGRYHKMPFETDMIRIH